ncbi:hypothetical protein NCAS_0I01540 [Naumovozyma castellii]|uniref:Temperature shock-inducible protein 1 n=1 Tax=Naumovozyma castellii TaxID=27288 RepID=G0VJY8_NAUCA|nr:hypothetical protein NCAS_0I01540 [Naumovozyma castellii CBS 4309]CCC71822.1 hypothetical protein NCAS_0I01540 [Naumovozyma castellii CBS 4309]
MSKLSILLAAVATASMVSALDTAQQTAELQAIIEDINSHLSEYLGLQTGNSGFQIPADVLKVYQQVMTYKAGDDSYTTLFSELNFDEITQTIVKLPWYSTRLLPAIEAAVPAAASSKAEATTSAAASSKAETTTSAAASSKAEATTSAAASSSAVAKTTVSSAAASSAKATAVSQITDGQAQAPKTVSQQTANGAAKFGLGCGAAIAGAAALLL